MLLEKNGTDRLGAMQRCPKPSVCGGKEMHCLKSMLLMAFRRPGGAATGKEQAKQWDSHQRL